MAKSKKINAQWRNRYERHMADPAFARKVYELQKQRIEARRGLPGVDPVEVDAQLARVDEKIAALKSPAEG
jgi:anti-sigma factor RsiW